MNDILEKIKKAKELVDFDNFKKELRQIYDEGFNNREDFEYVIKKYYPYSEINYNYDKEKHLMTINISIVIPSDLRKIDIQLDL